MTHKLLNLMLICLSEFLIGTSGSVTTNINSDDIKELHECGVLDSLFISHPSLAKGEDTLFYYPTWKEDLKLNRKTGQVLTHINPALATWSSSNPSIATVVGGKLNALAPGLVTITVELSNTIKGTVWVRVYAPSRPMEVNILPEEMTKWDHPCAIRDMPVLIIRYLPSSNGLDLDVSHAPDFFEPGQITLSSMKQQLDQYDRRVKYALEEGTRFRDYGQDIEVAYLGYRVVAMITVYEPTPRGKVLTTDANGFPVYGIDYLSMFDRLGLQNYIQNQGVKEIWFWQYNLDSSYPSYNPDIHLSSNFRLTPESNMASPLTGDVSNSYQVQDDLPIYDKTYIVYGQNIRRRQAEAIHNHGHQIERMIPYFNNLQDGNDHLFWRQFVGQDPQGNFVSGRCGWTHMPPNTETNYDYENSNLVMSDIMQWKPGGGAQSMVNVNTWGDPMLYDWPGQADFPQRRESQWYIYWFQSIPGHHNRIDYNEKFLSNWWEIIANWDKAYVSNYKLYNSKPDSILFAHTNVMADICQDETYEIAGNEFNKAGDYLITLQNIKGCDSIVLLNLMVHSEFHKQIDTTICNGDFIVLENEVYDEHGNYNILIDVPNGCDTILELDLSVVKLNQTVLLQNETLFSNQNGVDYQWIDCNSDQLIPGATLRVFHPTVSGTYAVILTSQEGCQETSECTQITITATEIIPDPQCHIFPNPSNGRLYVEVEDIQSPLEITLYDAHGTKLSTQALNIGAFVDLKEYASGIYWMSVKWADQNELRKFSLIR